MSIFKIVFLLGPCCCSAVAAGQGSPIRSEAARALHLDATDVRDGARRQRTDASARAPPMGWSSWYAFGQSVNQDQMEASFQKMVNRSVVPGCNMSLFDAGYVFANLDDGWQACGSGVDGSFHSASGEVLVDKIKFQDIGAMTKKAHDLGLKPGFYYNNYICGEGMPAGGEGGPTYMLNMRGSVDFLFAHGFKYVKVDSGSVYNDMDLWRVLIDDLGDDVVVENCHQGGLEPNATWCPFDLWRTSGDAQVVGFDIEVATSAAVLAKSRPGCWAYPDTISVLGTFEETRSQFGVYAIMSAPLILSFNILDDSHLLPIWDVLTNMEAIRVNGQWAGSPGRLLRRWSPRPEDAPMFASAEACNKTDAAQQHWAYDKVARQLRWQPASGPALCLSTALENPQGALSLQECAKKSVGGGAQSWVMQGGRLWQGKATDVEVITDKVAEPPMKVYRQVGILQVRSCSASRPGQRWKLTAAPGSSLQTNVQNDLWFREGGCWEITACDTSKYAEVGVNYGCKPLPPAGWKSPCDANGVWSFNANGTITSVMDGQCLEVDDRDNASVDVARCSNESRQRWLVNKDETISPADAPHLCVDSGFSPPPNGTTGRCAALPALPPGLGFESLPVLLASSANCDASTSPPGEQHFSLDIRRGVLHFGGRCLAARHGVPNPFGPLQLWSKPLPGGAAAVLVMHRDAAGDPVPVFVPLADLPGLDLKLGTKVGVRDLWAKKDLPPLDADGTLEISVAGGDSTFLLLAPLQASQKQSVTRVVVGGATALVADGSVESSGADREVAGHYGLDMAALCAAVVLALAWAGRPAAVGSAPVELQNMS